MEEKSLYDSVTSYVRSKRKEAKAKRNRNVELTLMVMQRRLASSIYAITRTSGEQAVRPQRDVLAILRDPSPLGSGKESSAPGRLRPLATRAISPNTRT